MGFASYSANPKSRAGALAIQRSFAGGHGRTMNVHRESKGESITQNANWLKTGKKPKVPAAVGRARYQQRKQKQQAQQQQATAQTKPKVSQHSMASGRDISSSFSFKRGQGKSNALDQVAEQQGFKGKPRVVTDRKEFSSAATASGIIAYRTINPGTDVVTGKRKTATQFVDDLKHATTISHNGSGGQVYGGGIYIAANQSPKKGQRPSDSSAKDAKRESSYYGNAGSKTVTMTLDSSAKIGDYKKIRSEFNNLPPAQRQKFGGEIAAYAASKGYDAVRTGVSNCDYIMVYNRTKLIIFDN